MIVSTKWFAMVWWLFLLIFMINSNGPSGCRFLSGSGWVANAHATPGALVHSSVDETGSGTSSSTGAARSSISDSGTSHSFTVEVNEGTELEPVDEQTRIDTMVRAFQRLPEPELARLGVDITGNIESGSERATRLKKAWVQRQAELKNAVDSMVKPAEFMAEIAAKLRDSQYHASSGARAGSSASAPTATTGGNSGTETEADVVSSLRELEGLVDDVDNARDFHTIGGWPILVGMLEPHHSTSVQAAAAWAIGTAVKNSYDYQLWTLESRQSHPIQLALKQPATATGDVNIQGGTVLDAGLDLNAQLSCLEKLVSLLHKAHTSAVPETDNDTDTDTDTVTSAGSSARQADELQRRVLYAVSSAIRGNTDVQEAVVAVGADRVYPVTGTVSGAVSGAVSGTVAAAGSSSSVFLDYLARAATTPTAPPVAPTNRTSPTTPTTPTTTSTSSSTSTSTSTSASASASASATASAEVVRKVWAIVADMLEERAYIRGELASTPDLPPEALPQLLSLRLLGDSFCTVEWAQRAVRALLSVWGEYHRRGEGVDDAAGRIVPDGGAVGTTAVEDKAVLARKRVEGATLRASMSSLLIVVKQLLTQSPSVWESRTDLLRVLQVQLLILSELQGHANEALALSAKDVLTLL